MSNIITGAPQQKFNPHEDWGVERTFIELPGASKEMIELGVLKVFTELEADMKKFVHPKCWKHVEWYRINPKPPIHGKLGWRWNKR